MGVRTELAIVFEVCEEEDCGLGEELCNGTGVEEMAVDMSLIELGLTGGGGVPIGV